MNNNLESKTDEELIAIYSSEYPSPIDARIMKGLMKNNPELYKEMEKRRLFVNLKHVITSSILKEYEKIQEEDKIREAERRERIIGKYDLSPEKFSKITIERRTGAKLRTEQELKRDRIIKIVKEMVEKTFESIQKIEEYKTLYTFQLIPLRRIADNERVDLNELSKTAESLKDLNNEKNYEVIGKFKRYMSRIYNETKKLTRKI